MISIAKRSSLERASPGAELTPTILTAIVAGAGAAAASASPSCCCASDAARPIAPTNAAAFSRIHPAVRPAARRTPDTTASGSARRVARDSLSVLGAARAKVALAIASEHWLPLKARALSTSGAPLSASSAEPLSTNGLRYIGDAAVGSEPSVVKRTRAHLVVGSNRTRTVSLLSSR